ncbi:MAG: diaminopimelate epimerase, partial [Christensenellales bacterium]
YVIEVNPRSSRTIPYISKVTGVPMVDLAVRAMLGEKLTDMGYGTGLYPSSPYVAVKVPVFSSEKLADVDTHLGPEMQSTGEVLGLANTLEEALYKGLVAAGYKIRHKGGVLLSVRHEDRPEVIDIAKQFKDMGFTLYATEGNAGVISKAGMQVNVVDKADISENDVLHLLDSDKVQYVVSTSAKGRIPTRDSVRIRRKAAERGIPCMTSMDTAGALLECLRSRYTDHSTELVEINHMRRHKVKLSFIRMHSCGNDYIYFNCFDQQIDNPEGLAVRLCDRHRGIGGDGVVLICPSQAADARMRLFNRDGTEGGIGGVALCCVAKYLYDSGMVKRLNMQIETASGMRAVQLFKYNGQATHARVNMGPARFDPRDVPVNLDGDQVISRPVEIGGKTYEITCLSMGNPHCVVFDDAVETLDVAFIGPQFEHNELFPERVNAEFIHMMVPGVLRMRVWERGNGETLACGTGACVAAVAAVKNGLCEMDTPITVKLNGGDVTVEYTDSAVYLTSDANIICEGTVEL